MKLIKSKEPPDSAFGALKTYVFEHESKTYEADLSDGECPYFYRIVGDTNNPDHDICWKTLEEL